MMRLPQVRKAMTTTMARAVRVLDGGTGEELMARGAIDERNLWSASALKHPERHETVKAVHADFARAGAQLVTTNNYSVTPGVGFKREEVREMTALAGRLAREAVDQVAAEEGGKQASLLGCLPPLGESYRADLVMEHAPGVEWYRVILEALRPFADIWLGETLSSLAEAKMVIEAVGQEPTETRKPLWISLTLQADGRVRSGEPVQEAADAIVEAARAADVQLEALLFNCCEPESITAALGQLKLPAGLQLGASPNFLTPVPEGWTLADATDYQPLRDDLPCERYVRDFVQPWIERGVTIVGGCCGTTPAHIQGICEAVARRQSAPPAAAAASAEAPASTAAAATDAPQ